MFIHVFIEYKQNMMKNTSTIHRYILILHHRKWKSERQTLKRSAFLITDNFSETIIEREMTPRTTSTKMMMTEKKNRYCRFTYRNYRKWGVSHHYDFFLRFIIVNNIYRNQLTMPLDWVFIVSTWCNVSSLHSTVHLCIYTCNLAKPR